MSIGEMEVARYQNDPVKQAERSGRAITAKTRVVVHGAKSAVEALARFEAIEEPGLTPAKKSALVSFLREVRKDLRSKGEVTEDDVERILFKRE